jgi:hypothetical protein
LNGTATISGDVNTAALINTSAISPVNGGNGGDFAVVVPASVTITGKVITSGGSTKGSGNGGDAGDIQLLTSTDNNLINFFEGNIAVGGFVESNGGNARSTAGGGKGGAAGTIDIFAGAMQIKGKSGSGASISASGGKGFGAINNGTDGLITLASFAIQNIPVNFNLTSPISNTAALEYALPGGLFTIGNSTVVNGTAGTIVSGSQILSKTNVPNIMDDSVDTGRIEVTAFGGGQTIELSNGASLDIAAANGNFTRTKVTPAQALALYQTSFGFVQTIGVNTLGQAVSTNPQASQSLVIIPHFDVPKFKSFNLATADPTNDIRVDIQGPSPLVNLSAVPGPSIAGQLTFSTGNNSAVILLGNQALTVKQTGQITSGNDITGSDLAFLGGTSSTWTNNGVIAAEHILMLMPSGGKLTFINNDGAQILRTDTITEQDAGLLLPDSVSMTANFLSHGGVFGLAVKVEDLRLPTSLGPIAASVLPFVNATPSLNLNFATGDLGVDFGGNGTVGNLTVKTLNNAITHELTPLFVIGDTNLKATGSINLNSSTFLDIEGGARLQAGLLKATAPIDGVLTAADVLSKGALTVTAGSSLFPGEVTIFDGAKLTSVGADIKITAVQANIAMGGSIELAAHGGNLVMLATGTVTGTTNNSFLARAVGSASASTGGIIELGSGTTVSRIGIAKPPTLPVDSNALGGNVTIETNGTNGFIQTTAAGGTIDLTTGSNAASVDLNRGIVLFHATGNGAEVKMDGGTFEVDAYKPIGYHHAAAAIGESIAKTNNADDVATVFFPGFEEAHRLTVVSEGDKVETAELSMGFGALFMHLVKPASINCGLATIKASKGAMFSVETRKSKVTVIALSGPGHVSVMAGSQLIALQPGEEICVFDPDDKPLQTDSISRRACKTYSFGTVHATIADVSISSLLTNSECMRALYRPSTSLEKQIANKILKTAAVVQQVTSNRGPYQRVTH